MVNNHPPNLPPALPTLEPSADRHHSYSSASHNPGRRGSTDPLLHASIAASVANSHHANLAMSAGGSNNSTNNANNFTADSTSGVGPNQDHLSSSRRSSAAGPNSASNFHSNLNLSSTPYSMSSHSSPMASHAQDRNHPSRYSQGSIDRRPSLTNNGGNYFDGPDQYGFNAQGGHAPEGYGHHNGSTGHGSHLDHSMGGGSSASLSDDGNDPSGGPDRGGGGSSKETPYSRTPELKVSHKLAERQRRKNMKNYFDELRDMLPVDRGPKTSKGDILQKAIEQFKILKQQNAEMAREMDLLRRETGVAGSSGGGTSTTYRSGGLHVGVTGGSDPSYSTGYMHPEHSYGHHAPPQLQHPHSITQQMGSGGISLPFMPSQPGSSSDPHRAVKNGVAGKID